jgi:hypothetical protein
VKLLRRLGHHAITTFHMNEGHAAFSVWRFSKKRLVTRTWKGRQRRTLKRCGKSASLRPIRQYRQAMISFHGSKCSRFSAATEPRPWKRPTAARKIFST